MTLIRDFLKHPVAQILLLLYLALIAFWVWIQVNGLTGGFYNNLYGALYPILSLLGGLYGILYVQKHWGGYKSLVGKGIIFLSLGLLAQVFGQWTWSYYTIIENIEVPYPSIADLGYFAIIPLYAVAMYYFAKAAGIKFGLRSFSGRIQAILIPALMIGIAYIIFLRDIPLDLSDPIRTFLDFGYPGLEPIAVSIGILTYSVSRNILGGIMRPKILFVIFALIVQYVTDYLFLYTAGVGTYYNANIVDLMYTTSYLIMGLAILSFERLEERRTSV